VTDAAALETDSFSDVVTSGGAEEAFDFDPLEYSPRRCPSICIDQLHGIGPRRLARSSPRCSTRRAIDRSGREIAE
jgi:hypothetical protein